MEAENAQETTPKGDGDTWQLKTDRSGYAGLGYMVVPNGSGGQGNTSGTAPNLTIDSAKMVFHINFTRTGRHKIWLRAGIENTATGGNDDSVFIGFNDDVGLSAPANDWLIAKTGTADNSGADGWSGAGSGWLWRSDRVNTTPTANPLTFTNTTTGLHRFIIYQREDGSLIDKIVIEAPGTSTSTTEAPAPCNYNGGLGEGETWDFLAPPPGPSSIVISSPTNGQIFAAGNLAVTATVTGPSPIVLVEFFQGTNLIGTATSSPYTIIWPNVPEGIYSLTARVTDILAYQATSAAVQIVEAGALTLADVTTPGDPIRLTSGTSPAADTETNYINNTTSKCLNYDAIDTAAPFVGPVGFVVTPSAGRSIVSKLRFYTANDNEARDPVNYVLEGSNDGSTWSLISSNLLTLPVGRNAAALPIDPFTQNVWHVAFANTTEYASYRLRFFNVKSDATANGMQLAEVELLGTVIEPPSLSIGTGTGGTLVISASQPGTLFSTTNLIAPIIWVNEGPISGTVIIAPAADVPNKYYRLSVP